MLHFYRGYQKVVMELVYDEFVTRSAYEVDIVTASIYEGYFAAGVRGDLILHYSRCFRRLEVLSLIKFLCESCMHHFLV